MDPPVTNGYPGWRRSVTGACALGWETREPRRLVTCTRRLRSGSGSGSPDLETSTLRQANRDAVVHVRHAVEILDDFLSHSFLRAIRDGAAQEHFTVLNVHFDFAG